MATWDRGVRSWPEASKMAAGESSNGWLWLEQVGHVVASQHGDRTCRRYKRRWDKSLLAKVTQALHTASDSNIHCHANAM